MNILVATPGRLLQHMDQTVGFDANNLQVLGKIHRPSLSYILTNICQFLTKQIEYLTWVSSGPSLPF